MFTDQNGLTSFVDQNGIAVFIDQNGLLLGDGGYVLSGYTKNNANAVLASCEVFLFKYDSGAGTLTQVDHTPSDSAGIYSFNVADNDPVYMVLAFKNGAPDVFDVSDRYQQPVLAP